MADLVEHVGGSHRFRVTASLSGRPFETFTLDVGIRSDEQVQSARLTTPDALAFADIEPVMVPAIPIELHPAEKLHAYTRTYEGARPSTRAKDLVDLALIAELSTPEAAPLRGAIEAEGIEGPRVPRSRGVAKEPVCASP